MLCASNGCHREAIQVLRLSLKWDAVKGRAGSPAKSAPASDDTSLDKVPIPECRDLLEELVDELPEPLGLQKVLDRRLGEQQLAAG